MSLFPSYASFFSLNFPSMAVSHQKFEGYLGDLPFPFPGAASTPNSFWIENVEDIIIRIVPGLADGRFVSFLALTNRQYYYWRNYKSEFRLDQPPPQEDAEGSRLFNADATFIWRPGHRESASSFVSFSHPDRMMRHRNFKLWLDEMPPANSAGEDLFYADASFVIRRVDPFERS